MELDEQSVEVRGKNRILRPGMSGRARIVVGRRTLANYAFGPLRRLPERVRGAPVVVEFFFTRERRELSSNGDEPAG